MKGTTVSSGGVLYISGPKVRFFFIIFLYKQYESKALPTSFPSEENLELSMQKLEPFPPFWDSKPSGEITYLLAMKSLDESP